MKSTIKRITERERGYALEVLDTQFRTSAGSLMTRRLEKKFADVFQSRYAISFINGTSTMHSVLAAAGIGPDDEVIVPPLTMASTSFAVLHAGAIPVFADIDARSWNIDPASIAKCLTPRTKAIIPVALYGLAPDYDPIMDIAKENDLLVLEDDAQCFLGYYKGRIVGSIGHAASFSFQSSKHMTSGEGGMITTSDVELANKIRQFGSLGYAAVKAAAGKGKITKATIQDPQYERHIARGWNYRMPELCAAVALGQLERLEELVEWRIRIAELFEEARDGCQWLEPQRTRDGCKSTYWSYVLRLNNNDEFSWYDFRDKYVENGGDGIYAAWQLSYLEPALRNIKISPEQSQEFAPGLCPVAEALQPKLLQFKTNYFDWEQAEFQSEVLAKTIHDFS